MYTFLESSDLSETKNQCFILTENVLVRHIGSQNGHRLTAVLTILSHAKQYRNSILVDMTTCLAVGKGWID